jgi:MFS transporter, DHA2 family, multidrug resistance protein
VSATPSETSSAPPRARLVLITLILVAAAARVALTDIGLAFDASHTELNPVAVGCSLGLA